MDAVSILDAAIAAALGPEAAVFALLAIGLSVQFGHLGLLNLGQVGFMLLGAYGTAITVAVFGGPLWLGAVVGLLLAAVAAVAVGAPTLRLPPVYLAVATLAAAEALRHLVGSRFALPYTGGPLGLRDLAGSFRAANPIPPGEYGVAFVSIGPEERVWTLLVGWGLVGIAAVAVWMLVRSPWGRLARVLRDEGSTVETLGKDARRHRIEGFVFGGVIGAAAGVLLVLDREAVFAAQFLPYVTFLAYAALLVGGVRSAGGPIVGAVALIFVVAATETALRQVDQAAIVGVPPMVVEHVRVVLAGLVVVALAIWRPEGAFARTRSPV